MPRFRFNLQAVLKQRIAIERQRQRVVAALEQQRLSLEDELRGANESLQLEKADLRHALSHERSEDDAKGVDLRGVRMQANAALHLVGKAQQTVLKLAGVHKRLEAARHELLAAAKARKGVETLREHRFEAWMLDQKQRDALVLDELAVMRGARASMELSPVERNDQNMEAA